MAPTEALFPTLLYRAPLGAGTRGLLKDLARAIRQLAADDVAGRRWCTANAYRGYTSYASLDDLAWRDPAFAELERRLDQHVRTFARTLAFDRGRALARDSLWVNLLKPGGAHGGHIHPGSAVSGTLYVEVPPGASAIRFEDPRLPLMMAAPAVRPTAPRARQRFISVAPKAGDVLLWESWLRHEVPANGAKTERLSVSFNYR
ncbi:MAG: hypothetical protein IT548_03885 [Alphaproteobacteria bacterium]|nr:hypothetical protein [Alphaproteobacteria bacterium]